MLILVKFLLIVALLILVSDGAPQFRNFGHGPPAPHSAVLKNAQQESSLPSHLRNPFYQDPSTARFLAYSSRLGPGERPVYTRDAEKIPRREIYNVLVHAGFISRERPNSNRLQIL